MDDEPPAGSRRDHRVGTLVLLTAIILAAVVMIVGSWPGGLGSKPEPLSKVSGDSTASLTRTGERIANYVGEAACLECHPGESALRDGRGMTEHSVMPSEARSSRG